jgi:3-oxoadipate enol-lactonase
MMKRYAKGLMQAETIGAGPGVWVLHSLLADAGSCRPLAQALAGRFRVVLPDLPGFGGSAPAGDVHAVAARMADAMAEDVAAHGPVAVIGNGYGSFVALLVALRQPGLVSRLVLAGTGAAFSEPGRAAFRAMAGAAAGKGLDAISDVAMRRLFSPAFQAEHPDLVAARRARFLATDTAVFTQACDDLATLDIRDQVGVLAMPALIMVGDGDEATPPPMARELAGLVPGARFEELAGLAHVPQLQDTARFVAVSEAFLGGA